MRNVTLKIPHIGYTVVVEQKKKDDRPGASAYTKMVYNAESLMVLPLPINSKKKNVVLVHEIIHVLQNICEGSNMVFLQEQEHMAYIADWLFQEICKIK